MTCVADPEEAAQGRRMRVQNVDFGGHGVEFFRLIIVVYLAFIFHKIKI
jgi:hypothetical protein